MLSIERIIELAQQCGAKVIRGEGKGGFICDESNEVKDNFLADNIENKDNRLNMIKVFELLETLSFKINKESWYDKEGIEGTRIISPDKTECLIYGWDNDCSIDELIQNIKDSYNTKV